VTSWTGGGAAQHFAGAKWSTTGKDAGSALRKFYDLIKSGAGHWDDEDDTESYARVVVEAELVS
jgi:hypothetical protein